MVQNVKDYFASATSVMSVAAKEVVVPARGVSLQKRFLVQV
jgi:hypothetical protein